VKLLENITFEHSITMQTVNLSRHWHQSEMIQTNAFKREKYWHTIKKYKQLLRKKKKHYFSQLHTEILMDSSWNSQSQKEINTGKKYN